MGARVSSWLAWFICLLCVALAAGSLILGSLNGRTLGEILVDEGIVGIATLILVFSVVGVLIASHRPENAIGWIFCAAAFFQGLSICGYEYATYALLTEPGSLPSGAEVSWLSQWIWAPGLGLILVFLPLLFPDERLPSRRWRPVAWISTGATALGVAVLMVLPWDLLNIGLPAENPFEVEVAQTFEVAAFAVWIGVGLASMSLSVFALIRRFSRSRGVERQQLKWFVYAGALTVVLFFLPLVPALSVLGSFLQLVAAPLLPVAAGVAILRHRLYDVDVLINRTLVYVTLTASLVLVYLGGVVGSQYLLRALTGQESQLAVVASTLVIAALFNPLRRRLQDFIDRLFYRNKSDAKETLEAFSARLRNETDLEALSGDLVVVVRDAVLPAHTSLWLREPARDPGEAEVSP